MFTSIVLSAIALVVAKIESCAQIRNALIVAESASRVRRTAPGRGGRR